MNNSIQTLKKYGKSFFWAGKFLPKYYLTRSAKLYEFCRKLDDLADLTRKPDALKKLILIKNFIKKNKYDKLNEIQIYVPDYLRNNNKTKKILIDLLNGLIFDQKKVFIKNEEELIQYCYKVAGTVGVLMCYALDCKNKNAINFAIDLGIAMQLTNIVRDILEDAYLNRRYIPGTIIENFSPNRIKKISKDVTKFSKDDKIIKKSLIYLINLSEDYYVSGRKGLFYLPFRIRLAIKICANVYREIGIIIINNSLSWYKGRYYTNFFSKFRISLLSILDEIIFLRKKTPIHQKNLHRYLKKFYNEK